MRQREAEERLRRILGKRNDEGITAELTYPEEQNSKRKEEEGNENGHCDKNQAAGQQGKRGTDAAPRGGDPE